MTSPASPPPPPPAAAGIHRVLVVMSTTRWSKRMSELGLEEAQAAAARGQPVELHVLYVVEQEEVDRAARSVGDTGFLGREVQQDLMQTLLTEHERVAERRRERVRKAVEALGCSTTWNRVVGDYEAQVHEAVAAGHYDVVILVQSRRSFIERLFYGAEDERVARWVRAEGGAEVKIAESV